MVISSVKGMRRRKNLGIILRILAWIFFFNGFFVDGGGGGFWGFCCCCSPKGGIQEEINIGSGRGKLI